MTFQLITVSSPLNDLGRLIVIGPLYDVACNFKGTLSDLYSATKVKRELANLTTRTTHDCYLNGPVVSQGRYRHSLALTDLTCLASEEVDVNVDNSVLRLQLQVLPARLRFACVQRREEDGWYIQFAVDDEAAFDAPVGA